MFTKKVKWPKLSVDDIRKRARILVIDDSEFYYLELFKKDGYGIEQWNDVDDLQKLESGYFDVILLDIYGVGKEQSTDQGFGILKHLRHRIPTQILIAYSQASWNLKYQEFFDMADARLDKSADYIEFKRTVDELLEKRFSYGFYVDKVVGITSQYINNQDKLKEYTIKAINNRSVEKLQEFLEKNEVNMNIIKTVIQIVSVAIRMALEFN